MIDGVYYCYYLFYTKVIKDNQPHSTIVFVVGFLLGLIINGILNIFLALTFKSMLGEWPMISINVFLIFLTYLFFYKTGRGKRIVEERSVLEIGYNRQQLVLAITLFVLGMIALLLEPLLTKPLLDSK